MMLHVILLTLKMMRQTSSQAAMMAHIDEDEFYPPFSMMSLNLIHLPPVVLLYSVHPLYLTYDLPVKHLVY